MHASQAGTTNAPNFSTWCGRSILQQLPYLSIPAYVKWRCGVLSLRRLLLSTAIVADRCPVLITLRIMSRRQREMYCGHARLCVCLSVRGRMPTLLHGPGCNLGSGRGCP